MKYFQQETGYTCGVATLRMVLSQFFDTVPDETSLAQQTGTTPEIGTHPTQMAALAEKYGLNVMYGEDGNLEDLDQMISQGYVIALGISVDLPHWVIYLGNNGSHCFFNDPMFGQNLSREKKKFISPQQPYPYYRWRIIAKEFKKYSPEYDFTPIESTGLWMAFKKL